MHKMCVDLIFTDILKEVNVKLNLLYLPEEL